MKKYFFYTILSSSAILPMLFINTLSFASKLSWNEKFVFNQKSSNILAVEQKKSSLILYTKALSKTELAQITKQFSKSKNIVGIQKRPSSITLFLKTPHFGYVFSKEALVLFYDKTKAPTNTVKSKKIEKTHKSTRIAKPPVQSAKKSKKIYTRAKATQNNVTLRKKKIQARIKPLPTKIKEAPQEFIVEQIQILESKTISPANKTQHIREKIDFPTNNTSLIEQIGVKVGFAKENTEDSTISSSNTYKINRGGPDNWETTEVKENSTKTELPSKEATPAKNAPIAKEAINQPIQKQTINTAVENQKITTPPLPTTQQKEATPAKNTPIAKEVINQPIQKQTINTAVENQKIATPPLPTAQQKEATPAKNAPIAKEVINQPIQKQTINTAVENQKIAIPPLLTAQQKEAMLPALPVAKQKEATLPTLPTATPVETLSNNPDATPKPANVVAKQKNEETNADTKEAQPKEISEKEKAEQFFKQQTLLISGLINRKDYKKALVALKNLRNANISSKDKEDILYLIAEVSEVISRTDKEYISQSIAAFNEAMNFNTASPQIPTALLQLGLLNGALGNTKEIEAYFTLIRTKYPNNENTPLTYYYLGKYFQDKKEYNNALVQYKTLEQKYSQFKYLEETIVSIIKTLMALGYYKETKPYIDFIDSRWPNLYQNYPEFLLIKAEVYSDLHEYNKSLETYWKYYNILPTAKNIDLIMAKIGDLYSKTGKQAEAKVIYNNIIKKYPDSEGYLIAKMRLAEESIVDDISDISQFFSIFDKPYNTLTYDTYKEIITKHSTSKLAPVAKAKLALWYFWFGKYNEALQTADEFKKTYPKNPLNNSIDAIIAKTLDKIATDIKLQQRIPALWKKYSPLFSTDDSLEPEYRLHIAEALYKEEEPLVASHVLAPFFKGRKFPKISEKAVSLAIDIYDDTSNWKAMEDLYYRVIDWELPHAISSKVLFSTATAFMNTKQEVKANTLWEKLFISVFTVPYYKGVSAYYLAMQIKNTHKAPKDILPYAQESLNNLILASKNKAFPKLNIDTALIKTLTLLRDVTKKLGALEDTLRYTILQEQYQPKNTLLTIEKANLLKDMGQVDKWKEILENIIQKEPNSLYGRLAKTELSSNQNQNKIKEYRK